MDNVLSKYLYLIYRIKELYVALAREYHVPLRPEIHYVPVPVKSEKDNTAGVAYLEKGVIVINSNVIKTLDELVESVYHEFRHVWQYYYYNEAIKCWIQDEKTYWNFYHSSFCVPESDSRAFASSRGQLDYRSRLSRSPYYYGLVAGRDPAEALYDPLLLVCTPPMTDAYKSKRVVFPVIEERLGEALHTFLKALS